MASIITPNVIRVRNLQQNLLSPNPTRRRKRMSGEADESVRSRFEWSSMLETMDRFLANNDENHIVQLLIHLERKTSVSRNVLARFLLLIILSYFLLSIKVLDIVVNVLLYFLPSYGTYVILQKNDLQKEELLDICRYWIFAGFLITVDPILTLVIPFWSYVKICLAIQFMILLPQKTALVNAILNTVVFPIYRWVSDKASERGLVPAQFYPGPQI